MSNETTAVVETVATELVFEVSEADMPMMTLEDWDLYADKFALQLEDSKSL